MDVLESRIESPIEVVVPFVDFLHLFLGVRRDFRKAFLYGLLPGAAGGESGDLAHAMFHVFQVQLLRAFLAKQFPKLVLDKFLLFAPLGDGEGGYGYIR